MYILTFEVLKNVQLTLHVQTLRVGVHAFQFWKPILSYGFGVMAWTCTTTWRWFLVQAHNAAHVRPLSKKWTKNNSSTKRDRAKLFTVNSSWELIILVVSNVKIGWKIAELCPFKFGAKVASWPILDWELAILAMFFWDMDFILVLPIIYIHIKGQTFLEVNMTQIDHLIL